MKRAVTQKKKSDYDDYLDRSSSNKSKKKNRSSGMFKLKIKSRRIKFMNVFTTIVESYFTIKDHIENMQ